MGRRDRKNQSGLLVKQDYIATGLVHYTWWPPNFGGFFSRCYDPSLT